MFTKTSIAKMLVTQLIAFKVARTTALAISDRTDIDPDGLILGATTGVAGEVAAMSVAPYTDKLVDKAIETVQKFQNKNAPVV